jgi:nicotinamide-nucleotide amidase
MKDRSPEIVALLQKLGHKLVLAESCTCGLIASSLGRVPGVSKSLCGSAVVYRADLKRRWLGVKKNTIKNHTTESIQVATQIAKGVLKNAPEAKWSLGVVGHLGPDAPKNKDGVIHIAIIFRNEEGDLKIINQNSLTLATTGRENRMIEAANLALVALHSHLYIKTLRQIQNVVPASEDD